MSKSVVLAKIAYYLPHDKSRSSNARHVEYIATKPEADRGDELAYRIGDDDYRPEPGSAAGHVEYAAERPGSSGLFGPEDLPPPDWREVAKELSHHDLPTWRVIVSLREDDAVRLGLVDRSAWEKAIRAGVQDAIRKMHLDPDRARWVAAFHQKQGHPHCHLVIWETPHQSARRRGLLEEGERKGVWRAFARELFRDERDRLAAEKAAIRDLVRDLAKGNVTKAAEIVRDVKGRCRLEVQALEGGVPGIPPILQPDKQDELAQKLEALAQVMPGKGRAALAYMPLEVKAQAREIADWILSQPGFVQSAERYADLARQLASHYSLRQDVLDQAGSKAYSDLRDRVAQVVVKAAALLDRAERQDRRARERVARSLWHGAWRGVERERLKMEAKAQLASMREAELVEERARLEREREIDGR